MRAARIEAQLKSIKDALNFLMPDGTVRFDDNQGGFNYDFSQVGGVRPTLAEKEVLSEETEAWGPVETEVKLLNTRARLLQDAAEIINGARAQTYGPPEISFGRIADIWNSMGLRMHQPTPDVGEGVTQAVLVTPTDVALILIGMKLSRTIGAKDHEDNWLDLAGYAGLGAELAEREYGNGS